MKTNIGTDTLTHEAKPHICASWEAFIQVYRGQNNHSEMVNI